MNFGYLAISNLTRTFANENIVIVGNMLHLGMVLILLPAGVALSLAPLCNDDIAVQENACISTDLLAQRILFCMFIFQLLHHLIGNLFAAAILKSEKIFAMHV